MWQVLFGNYFVKVWMVGHYVNEFFYGSNEALALLPIMLKSSTVVRWSDSHLWEMVPSGVP